MGHVLAQPTPRRNGASMQMNTSCRGQQRSPQHQQGRRRGSTSQACVAIRVVLAWFGHPECLNEVTRGDMFTATAHRWAEQGKCARCKQAWLPCACACCCEDARMLGVPARYCLLMYACRSPTAAPSACLNRHIHAGHPDMGPAYVFWCGSACHGLFWVEMKVLGLDRCCLVGCLFPGLALT
jgi:hypothetical protein